MIVSKAAYRNLSMVRKAIGDIESAIQSISLYTAIVQGNMQKEKETGHEVESLATLTDSALTKLGKAMNDLDIITNTTEPELVQDRMFVFDEEGEIHDA